MNYGWKPDVPDHRDQYLQLGTLDATALPPEVDLTSYFTFVFNQGSLGSCTANAISQAFIFEQSKQLGVGKSKFVPSRLFVYYNERLMEGTINSDAGAMIRDGIKSVNQYGVCDEKTLPYVVTKFTKKPTKACYTQALAHQSLQYARVLQDENSLKNCLANNLPFVFGFSVYQSFESAEVAKTGIVPMPSHTEPCLGGHAVICVGYNDATRRFKVLNSWGDGWGDKGYFYMPYEYMTNNQLADDFWNISMVETVK